MAVKKAKKVNLVLARRIEESLGTGDTVVYATNRDFIVILPTLIRCLLWSLVGISVAYSLSDMLNGIFVRLIVVLLIGLWSWFGLVPFLNYQYEILAFTKNTSGARALYRKGFWLKSLMPLKVASLVATPIRQTRALYQTLLRVGDIRLDAWGTDTDIFFNDCSDPFGVVQTATDLSQKGDNGPPPVPGR
jgi:hypothetical protein